MENFSEWDLKLLHFLLTLNQRVQGSSPCAPTNKINSLAASPPGNAPELTQMLKLIRAAQCRIGDRTPPAAENIHRRGNLVMKKLTDQGIST
jgi:hypothetical protein